MSKTLNITREDAENLINKLEEIDDGAAVEKSTWLLLRNYIRHCICFSKTANKENAQ